MVHIDAATLRKYPILGVLLGGTTAVIVGSLMLSGWPEARALFSQRAPDPVSVHEAVTTRGTRWVALTEGRWHCEQAITIERRAGVERWIRGPVEATEVPITAATDGDVLVAIFDGPVKCAERSGSSLTGVVGSTVIFTSQAALRRWGRAGDRVAILQVGASPRMALILLLGLAAIEVVGIALAGYYLMIMRRHSAPEPSTRLRTAEPIN